MFVSKEFQNNAYIDILSIYDEKYILKAIKKDSHLNSIITEAKVRDEDIVSSLYKNMLAREVLEAVEVLNRTDNE